MREFGDFVGDHFSVAGRPFVPFEHSPWFGVGVIREGASEGNDGVGGSTTIFECGRWRRGRRRGLSARRRCLLRVGGSSVRRAQRKRGKCHDYKEGQSYSLVFVRMFKHRGESPRVVNTRLRRVVV